MNGAPLRPPVKPMARPWTLRTATSISPPRLLAFEAEALGEALIWEPSRGGALFPHLYRPLRLEEMTWVKPLPLVEGRHQFPAEMV